MCAHRGCKHDTDRRLPRDIASLFLHALCVGGPNAETRQSAGQILGRSSARNCCRVARHPCPRVLAHTMPAPAPAAVAAAAGYRRSESARASASWASQAELPKPATTRLCWRSCKRCCWPLCPHQRSARTTRGRQLVKASRASVPVATHLPRPRGCGDRSQRHKASASHFGSTPLRRRWQGQSAGAGGSA